MYFFELFEINPGNKIPLMACQRTSDLTFTCVQAQVNGHLLSLEVPWVRTLGHPARITLQNRN